MAMSILECIASEKEVGLAIDDEHKLKKTICRPLSMGMCA